MTGIEELAQRVGLVALTQAEVDEWLMEVLIALLQPLPPSRVQLLVGKNSLEQKRSLVRALAEDTGFSLDNETSSGRTLSELLTEIRQLNESRDRVVHSYYERNETHQKRVFRSRRPAAGTVAIEEIDDLVSRLKCCVTELSSLVEVLTRRTEDASEAGSGLGETLRGVHEVIVAGHLHERQILPAVVEAVDAGQPIRLRLRGVRRELAAPGAVLDEDEFLAEINPKSWQAIITSPTGEQVSFGDTGWRNITAIAQEDDPKVDFAAIRRVGDAVQCSFEGGEIANAPWPGPRDRLAERAFGPRPEPGLTVPTWMMNLDGFGPDLQRGS